MQLYTRFLSLFKIQLLINWPLWVLVASGATFISVALANTTMPEDADCRQFPHYALGQPGDLAINEILAKSRDKNYLNGHDWIELHNRGNSLICLADYSVATPRKQAALPPITLEPGDFFVLEAIGDDAEGGTPEQITLSLKRQDRLTLMHQSSAVHELNWSTQRLKKGQSFGPYQLIEQRLYPTPGQSNRPYRLFAQDAVYTVRLSLPDQSYRDLMRRPVAEKWYRGELEFNGITVANVGISTKGSSSLRHIAQISAGNRSHGRFSFKVDINRYQDQMFMGMKRLHLNSGYGDPTYMRDAIAYHVLRAVKVPASEHAYVDLWFNQRHMGLYQLLEPVDGEYVEKYFPEDKANDSKGDLYKAFSSLQWQVGQSIKHFTRGRYQQLKLKTNEETQGTEQEGLAVMKLLKSINSGSAEYIDTDLMVRYIAAMTLISNYDSYFANYGNYFLYEQRSKNKFAMIPWDFNLALGRVIKPGKPCEDPTVLINHPTIAPIQERPMIARVLERPELLKAYHQQLDHLLKSVFNPTAMREFVEQKQALINDYVKADSTRFYSYIDWRNSFTEAVTGSTDQFGKAGPLLPFIDARYENVKKQLSGELFPGSITSGPCAPSH